MRYCSMAWRRLRMAGKAAPCPAGSRLLLPHHPPPAASGLPALTPATFECRSASELVSGGIGITVATEAASTFIAAYPNCWWVAPFRSGAAPLAPTASVHSLADPHLAWQWRWLRHIGY